MTPTDIVLIVAGVGYVLARRMAGQLIEIKQLLIAPVVLTVIGASQLDHLHPLTATTVFFAGGSIALSVAIGLLRGRTIHLGARDGQLWMRYRASTVGLWVLNLALKGASIPLERAISPTSTSAAERTLLVSLGFGILAETAVVLLRALHTDAGVAWTRGEQGRPHTPSPAFERARSAVRETGSVSRSVSAAGKRLRGDKFDW